MPAVSTPAAQAAVEELVAHAVSLHAASGGDLLGCFSSVVDPRARRGVRHRLAAILAMCTAAVLCGCTSLEDITAWICSADPRVLAALGCRRNAAGMLTPPHPETVGRVFADLGAQGLADHAGVFLARRAGLGPVVFPLAAPGWLPGIAVDGKAVRGAVGADGMIPYLLAAATHTDSAVVAERLIGPKTNEVRREAPCRISHSVRRNSKDSSWVQWLTRIRKVMGTRACHEHRWPCPDVRNGAPGDPRDMAKAELPEAQSPAMQLFIHRKMMTYVTGAVLCVRLSRCRMQPSELGRCPVRIFKEMDGTPKSRYHVRQGRTRDRLRGASPMATECP